MNRIVIVGTSGSGKSTVAKRIARDLGLERIELDALHWESGWIEADAQILRARVDAATRGERWVVDGNYWQVRDLTWSRADTIVWLDLPRATVMKRVIARTYRRITRREPLWNGNVERWTMLFTKDSIIAWAWNSYHRRRRQIAEALTLPEHAHLHVARLRSPQEIDAWLASATTGWDQHPRAGPAPR
jgi:adenylate kinase family enzyme